MNLTEREKALAPVKDGYHSVCELKLGQLSEGQEWDAGANTHRYDEDPLILILSHKDAHFCTVSRKDVHCNAMDSRQIELRVWFRIRFRVEAITALAHFDLFLFVLLF